MRCAERLGAAGIAHQRIDLDAPDPVVDLPDACSIVYFVPPRRHFDTDERLRHFLRKLPPKIDAFLYVSTSGVYGDQNGQLVDESTLPTPHSARAHRRLDAELQIKSFCEDRGIAWAIARVPGIYGPGRMPLHSIREARPVIKVSAANPGNRIHRDDLARALTDLLVHAESSQSVKSANAGSGIYNLGDNNYMSSSQFALEVARMAGLPKPPQISREAMKAAASTTLWSFLAESRRLDSRKVLRILSEPLRFSNPLLGIKASLEAPVDPAA